MEILSFGLQKDSKASDMPTGILPMCGLCGDYYHLHCPAGFKCTHEMTQLLAPGGDRGSASFRLFQDLIVRGYLAVRRFTCLHPA